MDKPRHFLESGRARAPSKGPNQSKRLKKDGCGGRNSILSQTGRQGCGRVERQPPPPPMVLIWLDTSRAFPDSEKVDVFPRMEKRTDIMKKKKKVMAEGLDACPGGPLREEVASMRRRPP